MCDIGRELGEVEVREIETPELPEFEEVEETQEVEVEVEVAALSADA